MNIHFVGIGGIGVSSLAKYYLARGHKVSGSDLAASEITEQMEELGAQVHIGEPNASLVTKDTSRLIYSPAIQEGHPERAQAAQLGIPQFSYPQALGELTKEHTTIAISGTHGKSTTTSMLGVVLAKAGLDPTVILGTKVKDFGNVNYRAGESEYLVIEADEYAASFLNYLPHIAVLTSLEPDHLDFYKTFENLKETFQKYIDQLPEDSVIVANKDDINIAELLQSHAGNVVWYSTEQEEAGKIAEILQIPGKHNVSNALAALAAARLLKVSDEAIFKALSEFGGSWRRFDIFELTEPKPYTLVSDYGHHPTEVRVTVEGAREKWPDRDIWLVYQPHQYQRTYYLFDEFVNTLSKLPIQKLLLMDIYDVAGREEGSIKAKVSSMKLAEKVRENSPGFEVLHIPTAKEVEAYLNQNIRGKEVIMSMGAGDIYQNLTVELTHSLQKGKI